MHYKNDIARYGVVAKFLHWVMALLILALIPLGWWMADLPLDLEKIWYYNFHKSLGIVVLGLALIRLFWRRISPPPLPPLDQSPFEKKAAHAVHIGLYVAFIAQPIIGIVHSWATGFPIVFFNSYALPNMISANKALAEQLSTAHFVIGWSIAAIVVLHICAALKHHYQDKDDILTRMVPFGRPRG